MTQLDASDADPLGGSIDVPGDRGASPLRMRRLRAAQALEAAPRRAQLGWADLAAWPAWADASADERDRWLWRAGAWSEAAALRLCIDGQVMKRLAERLGTSALADLLAADAAAPEATPASPARWRADTLDAELLRSGRECALAALPSALLRLVLRERLWPATLPPMPAMNTARAVQAMRRAEQNETTATSLRACLPSEPSTVAGGRAAAG